MTKIEKFDSLKAFTNALEVRMDEHPHTVDRTHVGSNEWANGLNVDAALKMAKDGDVSIVEKAKALTREIRARIDTKGLEPVWQHEVAGAFPCVPTYLCGEPENMIQCVPTPTNTGPVNVFFCGQLNSVFTKDHLTSRAAAVFAALQALRGIRPVNLFMVTAMPDGNGNVTVKVRTNPMVLSEAAFMVGHPAYVRKLTFAYANTYGWGGQRAGWAKDSLPEADVEANMRKRFGLGKDDLFIPPLRKSHLKDPVKWINGLLDKYRR
jgi:hypothetical protein